MKRTVYECDLCRKERDIEDVVPLHRVNDSTFLVGSSVIDSAHHVCHNCVRDIKAIPDRGTHMNSYENVETARKALRRLQARMQHSWDAAQAASDPRIHTFHMCRFEKDEPRERILLEIVRGTPPGKE